MDHSEIGHGSMAREGEGHGSMCSMNMLFTWNTDNLCIVFRQWRVSGTFSLIISLTAVVLLTAGYELVRKMSLRYDVSSQEYVNSLPLDDSGDGQISQRSWSWLGRISVQREQRTKMTKAAFYAIQVFYSFFIMLLFMTYNGWVMLSVAGGAFIGHLAFGSDSGSKTVACH